MHFQSDNLKISTQNDTYRTLNSLNLTVLRRLITTMNVTIIVGIITKCPQAFFSSKLLFSYLTYYI